MLQTIKQKVYDGLLSLGVQVKLVRPENHRWLQQMNIRTVLDVGANVGQFAARIHAILPQARIYSFEPIQSCYQQLTQNVQSLPATALPFALGEENTELPINISGHSPSSSLLPLGDLHVAVFPHSPYTAVETVRVRRLDDVAPELTLTDNVLVKIDVQGFEDRVIRGGERTIGQAKIIILETTFQTLYEGQVLFGGIYAQLTALGFDFMGNWSQAHNPADGSILYAESIFCRRNP